MDFHNITLLYRFSMRRSLWGSMVLSTIKYSIYCSQGNYFFPYFYFIFLDFFPLLSHFLSLILSAHNYPAYILFFSFILYIFDNNLSLKIDKHHHPPYLPLISSRMFPNTIYFTSCTMTYFPNNLFIHIDYIPISFFTSIFSHTTFSPTHFTVIIFLAPFLPQTTRYVCPIVCLRWRLFFSFLFSLFSLSFFFFTATCNNAYYLHIYPDFLFISPYFSSP